MLERKKETDKSEENRGTSSKGAILIALLVLLIRIACLTIVINLLVGSDSGGTIGVVTTTGELAVDIVDATDEKVSLVGKALLFNPTEAGHEILFEPGVTLCSQGFKVNNSGSVPVDYRISVSIDDKIDMEKFNEAFDVWISTDTARSEMCSLDDFRGRLEVGKNSDDTYYLFVCMKTSAGNEFQGKSYTGIGITIYAVQANIKNKE